MRQGLVFANMKCRRHRRDCELKFWSSRVAWWCTPCHEAKPVFAGSVFADSRLPLAKQLLLTLSFAHYYDYEFATQTCVFSADDRQLSSATIADWYGTFRDVLVDHAHEQVQSGCRIGGPGRIVQVDEALIGRRKYNRGRVVPGTWVVGLVDDQGDMRLEICPVRNIDSLTDIIARHVHRGSDIHSDCWRGYSTDRLEWAGFTHHKVNHSEEFVAEDGTHTQRIESQWRVLRRHFGPGGIPREKIADHLIEFAWRRKCRALGLDTFPELIKLLRAV